MTATACALLACAGPGAAVAPASTQPVPDATAYSLAVTHICTGALLFDGAHRMGTRSDALVIARDIRASTARRLARVTALPVPDALRRISSRWIWSQRRLAASYARAWVAIYDAIDTARTVARRARLAERLVLLVHAPDSLRRAAGRLELELHVPDCTGGGGPGAGFGPGAR